MTEDIGANPTLDPIGYCCDGCGRLFRDPYADLSAIRAAGAISCCPERKPIGLSIRIETLEAALTTAASGLCDIIDAGGCFGTSAYMDYVDRTARATLAEIKP